MLVVNPHGLNTGPPGLRRDWATPRALAAGADRPGDLSAGRWLWAVALFSILVSFYQGLLPDDCSVPGLGFCSGSKRCHQCWVPRDLSFVRSFNHRGWFDSVLPSPRLFGGEAGHESNSYSNKCKITTTLSAVKERNLGPRNAVKMGLDLVWKPGKTSPRKSQLSENSSVNTGW